MVLAFLVLVSSQTQSPVEAKVNSTLSQMTLEEKVRLISGVDGFYIPDIPRLGLPRLKMSDGPVGVRNDGPTTAYPAGLSLASSFDVDLAHKYGVQIGHDARARGDHFWLGPGVNLARVPQNGRNFEYLGEDPILSGNIAAHIIQGVQSQGVVATVKHFAGNEHENDRNNDDSIIDERTLRELYTRQFQIAVQEGGVWAVMCSYNLVNGTHASANKPLIDMLKKDWGFRGILMSDWGAAHDTLGTVANGLDLEMPSGDFMNMAKIKPLLDSGQVTQAEIDDKVRRILRVTYAMGWDTQKQTLPYPKDDPASEAVAIQEAREGTVLLKNDHDLLPLKAKHILVVGPNAEPAITGGGGSSYTTPAQTLSLLKAIQKQAPDAKVTFQPGMADPGASYDTTDYVGGVKAEYFTNTKLEGDPKLTQQDSHINFLWGDDSPGAGIPNDGWSARFTTSYSAPMTGDYLVSTSSDEGIRVTIDGQKVVDAWQNRSRRGRTAIVHLDAGKTVPVVAESFDSRGWAFVQVGISPSTALADSMLPDAEIQNADVVIASVGLNPGMEGEGFDRSFELPQEQQHVLQRVLAQNKNVVIVNNSGGPVDLLPFASASGIVQAWYPGGLGNQAVAEILFGKTNPSGKLALSWPKMLEGTYYETAYPSHDRKMVYKEGLYMGYRWFDKNHVTPLFPFGFGLSYTQFAIREASAQWQGTQAQVTVTVKNTGQRAGDEIVQVYTGYPSSAVDRPVKELKGYQRVSLRPGESKQVTITLPAKWLQYWDVNSHSWKLEPGKVAVYVGDSSAHTPAETSFTIPGR